jgi:late competence protein required for DNA uptake (superfamily II DNA/RNA helicase)
MKCKKCGDGKKEMIGVTESGLWKMYCTSCCDISLEENFRVKKGGRFRKQPPPLKNKKK